jgi:microcystin degradation protein MlrC
MDNNKAKADRLASEVGQEVIVMHGRAAPDHLAADEGIAAALSFNSCHVVMADPADNAGDGAPCFDAALGAHFPLRFGGKIGPTSGQPVDAVVTVAALQRDCRQSFQPNAGSARQLRRDPRRLSRRGA